MRYHAGYADHLSSYFSFPDTVLQLPTLFADSGVSFFLFFSSSKFDLNISFSSIRHVAQSPTLVADNIHETSSSMR